MTHKGKCELPFPKWEVDPVSGQHRVFASGLRNPNGPAWVPGSGKLWTLVNERDELGSDLVPDYMTSLQDGGFYGFPFLVAKAIVPDYALGAQTASLGLVYDAGGAARGGPDRLP